ncbi:hypothetical protein ASE69_20850 [Sphingomonas sp. Leaf208]|nr:hypothetical protein ASE69_20850 [Sphingomonas sp. Leaf208]
MLDAVCLIDHVETHLTRLVRVSVAQLLSELNTIVSQDRVEELPCRSRVSLVDKLSGLEFYGSLNLDDTLVKEADR